MRIPARLRSAQMDPSRSIPDLPNQPDSVPVNRLQLSLRSGLLRISKCEMNGNKTIGQPERFSCRKIKRISELWLLAERKKVLRHVEIDLIEHRAVGQKSLPGELRADINSGKQRKSVRWQQAGSISQRRGQTANQPLAL